MLRGLALEGGRWGAVCGKVGWECMQITEILYTVWLEAE